MKTHIVIFLSLLIAMSASAQTISATRSVYETSDTVRFAGSHISNRKFNLNRVHHTFCASLPIAVTGLAMIPADKHVHRLVVTEMPNFRTTVDDYLQYAPWAAHLTLGICGVKGCSKNWYQILATDAFAAVMMAAVVNGMKYSINRRRPDGGKASFPSGHTATAFTGATLLAHEYGCRSIWIPIAGYTFATATGVMRVLNNRHYVSDVLVGAAVGIITAELAYWATDAIFKDRKLFKSRRGRSHYDIIKYY